MNVCYVQVTRHLLKLFDNLADLSFKEEDEALESETTVALGMYSREGEYVPFSEPCVCEGQVIHTFTANMLCLNLLWRLSIML